MAALTTKENISLMLENSSTISSNPRFIYIFVKSMFVKSPIKMSTLLKYKRVRFDVPQFSQTLR